MTSLPETPATGDGGPDIDADDLFMDRAIEEARATIGRTSPNPPVGAVLVKDGKILSIGRTAPAGGPHAEVDAMRQAGEACRGATLYTTLEPCCHHGRTGPCSQAIIDAGVARVVVGCHDCNPLVCRKGVEALRGAGIDVEVGVREEDCLDLARPFFTWVERGRPYVVLKAAATLDGRIATPSGDSKWITGEAAREKVHRWRDRFDAVLIGARTVSADDPALTTRLEGGEGRDPVRVVLDGRLSIGPEARVYRQDSPAPTLLATVRGADPDRLRAITGEGDGAAVEALLLPGVEGRVDVPSLLSEIASRGIVSLLVEGGGGVHGAFVAAGVVDEIRLFLAPKLLGGGRPWLDIPAELIPGTVAEAMGASSITVENFGEDLLLRARLNH